MSIAIGQHATATNVATSVTTGAITTSPSGSTFVIAVNSRQTISSVTDSFGNTYTLKEQGAGFNYGTIYVCDGGTGGASHTATVVQAGTGDNLSVYLIEVTGATNPSFDAGATSSDTTGSSSGPGASVTTTNASDMVISLIAGYGGGGAAPTDSGAGFSVLDSNSPYSADAVSTSIVSSTGSYQDTYNYGVFNYAAFAIIALNAGAAAVVAAVAKLPSPALFNVFDAGDQDFKSELTLLRWF
jgi:hypothetical protein